MREVWRVVGCWVRMRVVRARARARAGLDASPGASGVAVGRRATSFGPEREGAVGCLVRRGRDGGRGG